RVRGIDGDPRAAGGATLPRPRRRERRRDRTAGAGRASAPTARRARVPATAHYQRRRRGRARVAWRARTRPEQKILAWYDRPMTPPIPIQVYGINLLVRLMAEGPADVRVHCPKGSPIRYGGVTAPADGFDGGANPCRE